MSHENLLRSVIREMMLRESTSARQMTEAVMDNLNLALGGADLVAVAAAATGVGAPEAAIWLKVSGVLGGIVNLGSVAMELTEEPPDLKGAAIDLAECIISILTIRAAGKVAKGVLMGADLAQAVAGIIEGSTGETLNQEQKATVVSAVSKAKSQTPRTRLIDVNKVIAGVVSPDDAPIRKDEFLDLISGDIPLSSLTGEQEEDLYQIYLQYRSDFQPAGTGDPRKVSKVGARPAVKTPHKVKTSTAAKSSIYYSFMSDGRLLYNGSQVVGNVTNMRKGDRIPESGLTLARVEYNDQGTVSKVTMKSPNGDLVNIPRIQ